MSPDLNICRTFIVTAPLFFLQGIEKKEKELNVLDQRRSNNILIEINRLPAPRHIKTAILNMDYSYFNKEIVEVTLSLPIIPYYPLLSPIIPYYPPLSPTVPYCPPLSPIIPYCPSH